MVFRSGKLVSLIADAVMCQASRAPPPVLNPLHHHAFAKECGDARESPGLLAKRVEVSRRQRHVDESRVLREDAHERVGVRVGQRFQQHAADNAVDGGVASNGQAERQDDDGRERRVIREASSRPPVLAPDLRQPLASAVPIVVPGNSHHSGRV
jgi:hypothetical protein